MRKPGNPDEWKIQPLAEAVTPVFQSDPDSKVSPCSPSIEIMPGGRIIVAFSQNGPGIKGLPGKKARHPRTGHWMQGRILVSNDHGQKWQETHLFPFRNARLFRDGHILFLIGENGELQIIKSADGGLTWSEPAQLTTHPDAEGDYAEPPAGIFADDQHIAMVWMRNTVADPKGPCPLSAVFMRAARGTNLTSPKQWTVVETRTLPGRSDEPLWRDAHVVRITDPDHVLHSADAGSSQLIFRAHGLGGRAMMAIAADQDGVLKMEPARKQDQDFTFFPFPGGHARFQILFDAETKLYWLISRQTRNSMSNRRAPEPLRHQLHFSGNLFDWNFAGLLQPNETALHELCAAIHGNTIFLAGTTGGSGTHRAGVGLSAVKNFKELVYP
ncbi:MAG: sialidase family protein [Kiritimatiellia bacterium]